MKIRIRGIDQAVVEAVLQRSGYRNTCDGYVLQESEIPYPRYHVRINARDTFITLDIDKDRARHVAYPQSVFAKDETERLIKIFEGEGITIKVIRYSPKRLKCHKQVRKSRTPQNWEEYEM